MTENVTVTPVEPVDPTKRGVAIVHYNRPDNLKKLYEAVKDTVPKGTKVVVCDDGSDPMPTLPQGALLVRGPNLGVADNKNRALWALQDMHYIAILEDDLFPTKMGWFEAYEEVASLTETHHFCRVADEKSIHESYPKISEFLKTKGYAPIYGVSPRGDFTFITSKVIKLIGGLNARFKGAGYAHGEWSGRIAKAGLVPHPLKYWDVKEARDMFIQEGDRSGGRWDCPEKTTLDLKANKQTAKNISKEPPYIYHPITLT